MKNVYSSIVDECTKLYIDNRNYYFCTYIQQLKHEGYKRGDII